MATVVPIWPDLKNLARLETLVDISLDQIFHSSAIMDTTTY